MCSLRVYSSFLHSSPNMQTIRSHPVLQVSPLSHSLRLLPRPLRWQGYLALQTHQLNGTQLHVSGPHMSLLHPSLNIKDLPGRSGGQSPFLHILQQSRSPPPKLSQRHTSIPQHIPQGIGFQLLLSLQTQFQLQSYHGPSPPLLLFLPHSPQISAWSSSMNPRPVPVSL